MGSDVIKAFNVAVDRFRDEAMTKRLLEGALDLADQQIMHRAPVRVIMYPKGFKMQDKLYLARWFINMAIDAGVAAGTFGDDVQNDVNVIMRAYLAGQPPPPMLDGHVVQPPPPPPRTAPPSGRTAAGPSVQRPKFKPIPKQQKGKGASGRTAAGPEGTSGRTAAGPAPQPQRGPEAPGFGWMPRYAEEASASSSAATEKPFQNAWTEYKEPTETPTFLRELEKSLLLVFRGG